MLLLHGWWPADFQAALQEPDSGPDVHLYSQLKIKSMQAEESEAVLLKGSDYRPHQPLPPEQLPQNLASSGREGVRKRRWSH